MRRLFNFDCCLFGYLPEPIKEDSPLSRESQTETTTTNYEIAS
jgi:hypothetical protein